jgi:hypothetical protein
VLFSDKEGPPGTGYPREAKKHSVTYCVASSFIKQNSFRRNMASVRACYNILFRINLMNTMIQNRTGTESSALPGKRV